MRNSLFIFIFSLIGFSSLAFAENSVECTVLNKKTKIETTFKIKQYTGIAPIKLENGRTFSISFSGNRIDFQQLRPATKEEQEAFRAKSRGREIALLGKIVGSSRITFQGTLEWADFSTEDVSANCKLIN